MASSAVEGHGGENMPPGKAMTMGQHMVDKGAQMLQSLSPIKEMSQHACTFAIYSHDMSRQIETHHFITRINQDFLQCAVYDSDDSHGRLIGVEYIISDKLYEDLAEDEQKLWHSHAYEIKSGLWMNPRIPEMLARSELENLAKTYGKFWCTWQTDRGFLSPFGDALKLFQVITSHRRRRPDGWIAFSGDKLPIGLPSLMMSPQAVNPGIVKPGLVQNRDDKYNISTNSLKQSRVEMAEPEWINPQADYWKQHGKGFIVDVEQTEMKKREGIAFP